MNLKTVALILTITFLKFTSLSQAPNWMWAQTSGGNNYDEGDAIAQDASGNIYVTGKFLSQTITFGSTILTSNGLYDVYIVKYSPTGNVIWAKSFGGTSDDASTCINVDSNGNIYIAGWYFSPSITFGTTTVNCFPGSISSDIYLTKLDNLGNVIWAKSFGGAIGEVIEGVSTDNAGNVYLTGAFDSPTLSFGSFTLTSLGAGHQVFFIAKLDPLGNALWGKKAGGISTDSGSDIITDATGNSFVTGYFHSSSISFDATTLTNQGFYNSFIVKYNNQGDVVWARKLGGTGDDKAYGICLDANSNAYVVGSYTSLTGMFGITTLTNAGTGTTGDMFLAKYDVSGNGIWAKSAGNTSNDFGINLNVDLAGNPFVIGWFSSPDIAFDGTTLSKTGPDDIFITKYDPSGNVIWAKNAGCDDYIDGNDLLINSQNEVYITGAYYCTSLSLESLTLTNASANQRSDILTAKLNSTLEINDKSQHESLLISPNPAQTEILLTTELAIENITVFDVLGNQLLTTKKDSIDIQNLPNGIYFIILQTTSEEIITRKFIKD